MKKMIKFFLIGSICIVCSCKENRKQFAIENQALMVDEGIKINQIQVLGTHNSYAKPVDSKVFELVSPIVSNMMKMFKQKMTAAEKERFMEFHPHEMPLDEMLKYNHLDFETQLNAGLRSLEMDIYYDPTGNRFQNPASYRVLRSKGITDLAPFDTIGYDKPGFKMFHMADIDFRTHYPTFKKGLQALKKWSDAHPTHAPIFIMVEAKDKGFPILPNSSEVLPFDAKAFNQMDALVIEVLGREKLIIPDDVRANYTTLEEAVLANNWPLLKESIGKFVFLLLPSAGGIATESAYVKGHPNLENRTMFVQSQPNQNHAAFLLLDNAKVRQQEIQQAVAKGYMVRTRSDIETYEAKVNDYSRAEAAFSSGAQVISTDFFRPGNTYGTDYYVKMPNGKSLQINPLNTTKSK